MDGTDEIKKKIENVRDLIILQDGEAVYDCNFRELDEALALLESARAEPMAEELKVEIKDAAKQGIDFIKAQSYVLDARQKEIERLKKENKQLRGEKPIPDAWWKDCPELAQKTMERIIEENELLHEYIEQNRISAKAEPVRQDDEGEFSNEEDLVQRVRKAIAFIDPLGKQSKIDRRKVPDNAILELCRRLDAQQKEIEHWEKREMAICPDLPEGGGFEDYIKVLELANNKLREERDAQQREIERLKTENNRFREEDGWKDIVHCQTNAIIAKDKEIDRLTAENAKLKQDIGHLHGQGLALYESTKKECDTIRRMDVNAEQMDKNYGQMVLERDALKAENTQMIVALNNLKSSNRALFAENKALTERIAELEKALIEIKQGARTYARSEIHNLCNEVLQSATKKGE